MENEENILDPRDSALISAFESVLGEHERRRDEKRQNERNWKRPKGWIQWVLTLGTLCVALAAIGGLLLWAFGFITTAKHAFDHANDPAPHGVTEGQFREINKINKEQSRAIEANREESVRLLKLYTDHATSPTGREQHQTTDQKEIAALKLQQPLKDSQTRLEHDMDLMKKDINSIKEDVREMKDLMKQKSQ